MKILFHIHTLTKGGAERAVANLAQQFCNEGHKVTIVTSIKCESEYEIDSRIQRLILSDKTNETLGGAFNRMLLLGLKLRKIVRKEKPDVVIAFISGSIVRSVVATIGLRTKVIGSVRNDPSFEYRGAMGRMIVKYIFPKVDGFVFQTKTAQEYFDKKLQDKSIVICNSVNPIFYEVSHRPVKHRIVNCGRLDTQKNQSMLISAFKEVREKIGDAELFIYGKGPERDRLQQLIDSLGLNKCCFLCGETSDIPTVMENADIFVLSSDFEGMPNVLIEAITAGVPSISTDCPCGGPREIIENGSNGILIKVNDKEQMVCAILRIIDDDNYKKVLSSNAKKSSNRFNADSICTDWLKFIDAVLSNR